MPLWILCWALVGCTADTNPNDRNPENVLPRTPAQESLHKYSQAVKITDLYDFSATTLDGSNLSGSEYSNGPLAVWFWTPWCPTCNTEASEVVATAEKFSDIKFLGIAGKDTESAMQEFVDKHGVSFPTLVDSDGDLWRHFGVTGQPAWVFVAASGATHRTIGAPNQSELEEVLDALPNA